jgi:putative flippase GtrA
MNFSAIITRLKKIPFLGNIMSQQSFGQFKRYLVTGFLCFGIEYALFNILFRLVGLGYIWANSIALATVFWVNFLMNRYWSFKSRKSLKVQLPLYAILFAFNILATNVLMYLLSDLAGINPSISKLLVMGAVVSWNFILYKKVIYR